MSLGSPYSPNKVFYHLDRLTQLREGVAAPLQIELVISNRCNLRCEFCAYRSPGYPSNQCFEEDQLLSYAKILEILDDCRDIGVKAIQITGGGEPLTHPQFTEILNAVLDRGLDLAVVSNGVGLEKRSLSSLLRATWVRFSIDAGHRDTYAMLKSTSPKTYDQVWDNVSKLVASRTKKLEPTIGLSYVITKDNWREIVPCVVRAKDAGVDNIRLTAVFTTQGKAYYDGFYDDVVKTCVEARTLTTQEFRVFDGFTPRFSDLLNVVNYTLCGYQILNTYIGADCQLYRCCKTSYNDMGRLGSLEQRSLKEVWMTDAMRDKLWGFDARSCVVCPFNEKNKIIKDAFEGAPMHVNFI